MQGNQQWFSEFTATQFDALTAECISPEEKLRYSRLAKGVTHANWRGAGLEIVEVFLPPPLPAAPRLRCSTGLQNMTNHCVTHPRFMDLTPISGDGDSVLPINRHRSDTKFHAQPSQPLPHAMSPADAEALPNLDLHLMR
jgi:hypothetical protein